MSSTGSARSAPIVNPARAAAILALFVASAEARAQADPAALDRRVAIEGDDPCYERALVLAQLQRWLERSSVAGDERVVIEAAASRPTAFRVVRGSRIVARRRFDPSRAPCAEQRAATTLAIAIALDPGVLHWITELEPGEAPAAPSESAAVARAAPAASPIAPREAPASVAPLRATAPHRRSPWGAAVSLDALFSWGTLAAPAGGASLSLAFSPSPTAAMFVRAGSLVAAPAALGEGVVLSTLAFAQAGACVTSSRAQRLGVEGCASVLGGLVFARGEGYVRTMDASSAWGAGAVALGGRWSMHPRVALWARAEWVAPWVALRFDVLDGGGQVARSIRPSVMGAAFSLSVAVTIF